MDVAEFERLLHIGLGRPILYLKEHEAAPFRDAILYACLHNVVLDCQSEGSRAPYMLDIIDLTGEKAFYRDQILSALRQKHDYSIDDFELEQLLDFASLFTQSGDIEARQLVYDKFSDNLFGDCEPYAVVKMDGIDGFLYVARRQSQAMQATEAYLQYFLLEHIYDKLGEHTVDEVLDKAAKDSPILKTFLADMREDLQSHRESYRDWQAGSEYANLNYEQFKEWGKEKIYHNLWARWAKSASEEDLLKVAADLLKTDVNDIGEILDYLTAFRERRFPLDFSKLVTLAEGHSFDRAKVAKSIRFLDKNVPNVVIDHTIRIALAAAFNALENIGDPSVRAFAIRMIESGNNASRAVGLLTNNFRDGDWTFIQELARRPLEEEDRWILAWTVLDIFAAYPSKDAVGTLLVMYETAPCASCRLKFVETLHHLEALPDWIIEECQFDSNFDLRAKAIEYAKITD